ncbi:MAG: hypothetical protein AAF530_08635 [Pseudomonadota bacterium]
MPLKKLLTSLLILLCLGLLSACGAAPFKVPSPKEARDFAGANPRSTGESPREFFWEPVRRVQALSYCYSTLYNTPEDVKAEAEDFCRGGTVEFYSADSDFFSCALLQPHRLTFICFPGDDPDEFSDLSGGS